MARQKTGGRKKGTPNKLTASLKAAIEQAFDQVGGVKYLVSVANEHPQTFCALLGKLLPNELTGAGGEPLIPKSDPMDAARRIAFLFASQGERSGA